MHWRIERFKHTFLSTLSIQANTAREYLWCIREKRLPKTPVGKVLFYKGCSEINSSKTIILNNKEYLISLNLESSKDRCLR